MCPEKKGWGLHSNVSENPLPKGRPRGNGHHRAHQAEGPTGTYVKKSLETKWKKKKVSQQSQQTKNQGFRKHQKKVKGRGDAGGGSRRTRCNHEEDRSTGSGTDRGGFRPRLGGV